MVSGRRVILAGLFVGAVSPSAVATAQAPDAGTGTLKLSDSERADLLSHNTETSVDAARSGLGGAPGLDRQIHGTIGAELGSRGYRSVYGAATVPLGENAGAAVSFESSRFDAHR